MKKNFLAIVAVAGALVMSAFSMRPTADVTYVRIQGSNRTQALSDYRYQPSGVCIGNTTVTCQAVFALPLGQSPVSNQQPPAGSAFKHILTNGQYKP